MRLVKMPPELEKALMVATGQPARAFTVGEMIILPAGESPPDGYVDVTREVRNGVRDLRGEPPLPEPRDLPPAVG